MKGYLRLLPWGLAAALGLGATRPELAMRAKGLASQGVAAAVRAVWPEPREQAVREYRQALAAERTLAEEMLRTRDELAAHARPAVQPVAATAGEPACGDFGDEGDAEEELLPLTAAECKAREALLRAKLAVGRSHAETLRERADAARRKAAEETKRSRQRATEHSLRSLAETLERLAAD
jgi:hypothetical protein